MYDESDFDKSFIPNSFKREVRETIVLAVSLGWKFHVTGDQSATIISPRPEDHPKKYHFSTNRRSSNSITRIRRDVVKYGDPEKVEVAYTAASLRDMGLDGEAQALVRSLPSVTATVVDDRSDREKGPADNPFGKGSVTEPPKPRDPKAPHIVSEKPMLAKASKGKAYDSPTTMERRWSDGSRDYACRWPSCNYSAPERGSVPSHYAKSHSEGLGKRPEMFSAEVPDARVYAPRQSRVEALAAILADLMAGGPMDPDVLARTALTWVHEQSNHKTDEAAEREDLTPEQTLDRIRMLLDDGARGEMHKRVEALEQKLVDSESLSEMLQVSVTELEKRLKHAADQIEAEQKLRAEAERKAKLAKDTLAALHELAGEYAKADEVRTA
jgi:hypothetical protein